MNHIILLGLCFFLIEIYIRSNYLDLIKSIIKVGKKSIKVISNKNISDHWKENIIPQYSMQMMKSSLKMLLIIILIILIFLIINKFLIGFLAFLFSLNGIIESLLFAFSYAYIRKIIIK